MKLKVKQINGETTEHEVDESATVLELKTSLASSLSIESDRQRLIYAGRVLRNEDALSVYGVTDDCTLHLVVKPQESTAPAASVSQPTNTAPAPAPANRQIFTVPMDMGNMVVGSFQLDGDQDPSQLSSMIESMIQTATQQAQVQLDQQDPAPRRERRVRIARRASPAATLTPELRQSVSYALAYLQTIVQTPLLAGTALRTSSPPHIILSRLLVDTSTALNHVQNQIYPLSVQLASGLSSAEETHIYQQLRDASTTLSTLTNISHFVSLALQQFTPSAPIPVPTPDIVSAAEAYMNTAPQDTSPSPTHPATIQPSPAASVSPARPAVPSAAPSMSTPTNPQQPAANNNAAGANTVPNVTPADTASNTTHQQLPPGTAIRIDIPNLAEMGGQLPPAIAQLISGLSGVPPAAAGNAMQGLMQNMLRSAGGAATAAFNASASRPAANSTVAAANTAAGHIQSSDIEQRIESESGSDISEVDMVD